MNINIVIFLVPVVFVAVALFLTISIIVQGMKKNEQTRETLGKEEKQVEIQSGVDGFPDVLILENLLKRATITARYIEETDKVILRFEMVDDEGKHFFKTLEFDTDRIIHDLEIL